MRIWYLGVKLLVTSWRGNELTYQNIEAITDVRFFTTKKLNVQQQINSRESVDDMVNNNLQ